MMWNLSSWASIWGIAGRSSAKNGAKNNQKNNQKPVRNPDGTPDWVMRLLPGCLSAVGLLLALKLGFLTPLEQIGYRALFQLRGEQTWDDRLVLIKIDDASLAQLGRFPWSRQRYVELLKILSTAQANEQPNLAVFDLLLSESSPDDPELAQAMSQHGHVILAQAWDERRLPLQPVPPLLQNALGTGHILTQPDSDGLVHQVLPQINGIPMLGLVTIQARNLIQDQIPLPNLDQPLTINWVAGAESLPQYSFVDVVQGRVAPQQFAQKIVLIGVTATGLDPLILPFASHSTQPSSASSVVLHATIIQNLLQQQFLRPLPVLGWLLLFGLGGPVLGWGLSGRGWLRQVIAVSGLWAGWLILAVCLLRAQTLLPMAAPLALVTLTGGAVGLSDRLREAAQLRSQITHLQADEALKEEFLRTASHELRAPVANIQCAISLLKLTDSPVDRDEYLQILEDECQQEFAIINDLLDFQRLSNQISVQFDIQDLRDWLSEVLLPFQLRAEANQQDLEIEVNLDCPTLQLDWFSLRRILTELLNNACKYTRIQEQISVKVQMLESQRLQLQVSNSGIILPQTELTKLFQPFYRNVEVDQRRQGGTGLGLAIVKRLVEHLGGEISVTNPDNRLIFGVQLPVVAVPSLTPTSTSPLPLPLPSTSPAPSPSPRPSLTESRD
jgi:signal transduction histidine kinase